MTTLLGSRARFFLGALARDCSSSNVGVHTCDSKRRIWRSFYLVRSILLKFDHNKVERSVSF